jgi:hypothetical protein
VVHIDSCCEGGRSELFALWLQRKDQECRQEYIRKKTGARNIIAEYKSEGNRRWGERVTSQFTE